MQRLVEMQKFTRVTAPFSGVVTARNIDIGSLITAAGATSAPVAAGDIAGAMGPGSVFRIAQADTVRTYLPVPENYATSMTDGLPARVEVPELRGRTFIGHIARTSHALDAGSRTLLTEVDIANPGFALLPGMYAQVRLQFPMTTRSLIIPAAALVIRSQGTQVMVVDSAGRGDIATIHLRPVQIGRDYGSTMEILSGVTEGTRVVANPTAELLDGMRVKVTAIPEEPGQSPAGGAKTTAAPPAKK
jgi:RND family efflux transporter MFP subunit